MHIENVLNNAGQIASSPSTMSTMAIIHLDQTLFTSRPKGGAPAAPEYRAGLWAKVACPVVFAMAIGCGGAKTSAKVAELSAPEERIDTGATYYESEIGGMNEDAVDDTFKRLSTPISRCFENGLSRVESLGGSFTVTFRVDRSGKPKWAYMKSSTIGDRPTESCILDLVRNKAWPKPLSGEGLANKTIDIEPGSPPHMVESKKVNQLVLLAKNKTATCRKGQVGAFIATAYLEPDGRVRTAGVAPPNEKGESVVDCLIEELQKLKFRPTGKLSKVTFEI